jgi:selenocysteine lyase/cysteine desulfurase
MHRRQFLARSSAVIGAAAFGRPTLGQDAPAASHAVLGRMDDWKAVRAEFNLDPALIHMSGFFLASHPRQVREAIDRHRRGLDANPIGYHQHNDSPLTVRTLRAAAEYLEAPAGAIALTDSTTMGLGLVYGAIALQPGQETLTTTHDHYSTHRSLELRAERTGTTLRAVTLYRRGADVSVDAVVGAIRDAVTPRTRLVAVTWVHSGTGVKLPIRALADALAAINASRDVNDQAILCVDGVHGLGIEDFTLPELGCDVFIAGTHKWLFGPRGTGLLWASPRAQSLIRPFIPPFTPEFPGLNINGEVSTWGPHATPGGFHSFEHRWALADAFEFHQRLGKARIANRIHALNRQLKEGLASMRHVTLHTPMSDELSAGIVCFEVDGLTPEQVVRKLAARSIVASISPYEVSYARLAPSLLVDESDVDACLREIHALA